MKRRKNFSILLIVVVGILLGCEVEEGGPDDWAAFEQRQPTETEPVSVEEEVESETAEEIGKRQAELMERYQQGIFTFKTTDIDLADQNELPHEKIDCIIMLVILSRLRS